MVINEPTNGRTVNVVFTGNVSLGAALLQHGMNVCLIA